MNSSPDDHRVLAFAHIGDLHLTDAKQRNFADFLAIVAQIETELAGTIDFIALPGDNADNGKPAQYALAATALRMLSAPVHIIPGDHDMEQGNLGAFYAVLGGDRLPRALTVRGMRCLFIDMASAGRGGPDFRLGSEQLRWIENELKGAKERSEPALLFMHTYPSDLKGDGEAAALTRLIAEHDVALVDMGHTHYNELANDGHTIFAATRSTGQIEEGAVGYSLVTVDDDIVSWRFKPLDAGFPFVMITAPADHRLTRGAGQTVEGAVEIRALTVGRRPVAKVECKVEDGGWGSMTRQEGSRLWCATTAMAPQASPLVTIEVRAWDQSGRPGTHTIRAATTAWTPPKRAGNGSDADSIGAWPENEIWATQLGPNRNGKAL